MPKRHSNHQLSTDSKKALERIIPSSWVVRTVPDDYELTPEQLSAIEYNLGLSIEERIIQLQSAVELIEELRRAMDEVNENRFQSPSK
jgi:hypothetical protein